MFIIGVITSCNSLHKDICYFVNRSNLYPKPSLNMKTTRQGEEDDLCDVQHLSIYYLNIWCKFNLYSLRLKIDKLVPTFLQHQKFFCISLLKIKEVYRVRSHLSFINHFYVTDLFFLISKSGHWPNLRVFRFYKHWILQSFPTHSPHMSRPSFSTLVIPNSSHHTQLWFLQHKIC